MFREVVILLGLVSSSLALTCGSTTAVAPGTSVSFSATGPSNCGVSFTSSSGFVATCTMNYAGTYPSTCTTDTLKFTVGSSVYGPYCGKVTLTLTSSSPSLTINYVIGPSTSSLSCVVQAQAVTTTAAPTTITTTPINQATCSCGVDTVSRIIGGQNALALQNPWQVRLNCYNANTTYYGLCGGSLISQDYIVTAAHCVEGALSAKIFLGSQYQSQIGPYEVDLTSTNLIKHPQWNPSTLANDIALIKLPSPVAYSTGIQPICLPLKFASNTFAGNMSTVTGWGQIADNGATSDPLKQTNMTVLSNAACATSWGSTILPGMLCAKQNGTGTCHGDSGGPLVYVTPSGIANHDRSYLIGVVSFGNANGCILSPSVFTRVTSYISWIQTTTGEVFCNK